MNEIGCSAPSWCSNSDVNRDGKVNTLDLLAVRNKLNTTCSGVRLSPENKVIWIIMSIVAVIAVVIAIILIKISRKNSYSNVKPVIIKRNIKY